MASARAEQLRMGLLADLEAGLYDGGSGQPPLYAGAVVLVRAADRLLARAALGHAVCYVDAVGTPLPAGQQVPMTPETIFDLASVSKLFTSIVVLQQVEYGRLQLDRPVARYVDGFTDIAKVGSSHEDGVRAKDASGRGGGKDEVTIRHLLTHTSGLPAVLPLWQNWPDPQARIQATLAAPLCSAPGTAYCYSDLNMITLGVLAEQVAGARLDTLVSEGITTPLGMVDTGYRPGPQLRDRIAATEYVTEPPRGLVRGAVHDENAWSLGGVTGHAGVFSTADDLAALAEALLDGGAPMGDERRRILAPETLSWMLTNANEAFPSQDHGLGFELNQRWYMGALATPRTAGHTGFTGTSLVIEPTSRTVAILLTNRVHPSRAWSGINQARRSVARYAALAAGWHLPSADTVTAWYAGPHVSGSRTSVEAAAVQPHRSQSAVSTEDAAETADATGNRGRDSVTNVAGHADHAGRADRAGYGDQAVTAEDSATAVTLILSVPPSTAGARLGFDLYGHRCGDPAGGCPGRPDGPGGTSGTSAVGGALSGDLPGQVRLEHSVDGARWEPLACGIRERGRTAQSDAGVIAGFAGRRWYQVTAELPARTGFVRWTYCRKYSGDQATPEHGCYVDGVRLVDREGRPMNGVTDGGATDGTGITGTFFARGWRLAHD